MGALEQALSNGPPDTVAGWRAAADSLLSPPCCTFHRNMEISSRYAWLRAQLPTCFKWAGMAAIASHHVRLVLFPFRLDADRSGYVDLPRSLSRRRLLTEDAHTMREVNHAIYHDIFWVHLAYLTAADGVVDLRRLLRPHPEFAGLLSAFETIDRGRAVLADQGSPAQARRAGADLVWAGNLALLEHEQRVVVQPLFDHLSGTFARLVSMGSTTTFEVRGLRQEVRYFTSFSAYSLTGGLAAAVRTRTVPSMARFDDRWRWLETVSFRVSVAWTPTRTWWTGPSPGSSKRPSGTRGGPASSRPDPARRTRKAPPRPSNTCLNGSTTGPPATSNSCTSPPGTT